MPAKSRIKDADFAAETAEFTQANILKEAGTSVLAQTNALPKTALPLLQAMPTKAFEPLLHSLKKMEEQFFGSARPTWSLILLLLICLADKLSGFCNKVGVFSLDLTLDFELLVCIRFCLEPMIDPIINLLNSLTVTE